MRDELNEYQFVARQLSEGHRFVRANMTVGLMCDPSVVSRCESKLINLYRGRGFELKREDYLHLQSFLSCLPMSFGDDVLKELKGSKRLKTTISSESANLLPLQGEWYGNYTPAMLFEGRRGQLLTWSPFDNQAGNYNVSVVGRSGAGKSVFMQELMTSTLRQNGKVFVLDVGRSFQKTCQLLRGQFIEFTPKNPLCVNPFSSLKGLSKIDAEDRLATLKPVLMSMVAPHESLSDLDISYLDQAMRTIFFKNYEKTSFTKIADYLLNHEDPRAKDLGTRLIPYTKEGVYGKFFEGESTVNFKDTFVVVEFEELKERKDLQSVIIQMVIVQMSHSMFLGDRKTPFMICFDEAWDMLRGNQTGVFIETLARRLRKYNGALVVGTQSVNDFYATPGALAAFENSDWLCMLSQKAESINILKEKKRIAMTDVMEKDMKSVHTKAGDYAEVMITGPHGYAINRLVLDTFSQTLYSTTPKIFNAVQTLVDQGCPIADAIEKVAGIDPKTYQAYVNNQQMMGDVA
ncbi:MAG: Protein TraC [Holosporales bacterium]